MQKRSTIQYQVFPSTADLDPEMKQLFAHAARIRERAYAPYSHFKVGAALLLGSGEIVCGSNQENAAYPVGLCAERVAIFQYAVRYPDDPIRALAVLAGSGVPLISKPAPPCGSCRQAIAEYETRQGSPIRIAFKGTGGEIVQVDTVKDLLPFSFSEDFL